MRTALIQTAATIGVLIRSQVASTVRSTLGVVVRQRDNPVIGDCAIARGHDRFDRHPESAS